MAELWFPQGGVNRKQKELWLPQGGVNRKQKELWAGSGGVNRKIFAAGIGYSTGVRLKDYSYATNTISLHGDGAGIWSSYATYGSPNVMASLDFTFEVAIPVSANGEIISLLSHTYEYKAYSKYLGYDFSNPTANSFPSSQYQKQGLNDNVYTNINASSATSFKYLSLVFSVNLDAGSKDVAYLDLSWLAGELKLFGYPVLGQSGYLPIDI